MSNYAVWPFLDDPTTEENLAEKECQKIGLSLANIDPLALASVQELSSMYYLTKIHFLKILLYFLYYKNKYKNIINPTFFKGVKWLVLYQKI